MNKEITISKALILGLLLIALFCFSACSKEEVVGSLGDEQVFVHVGSPLMLKNGEIKFLDDDDYGAAVYKEGKKIYLPAAASQEIFGKDFDTITKAGRNFVDLYHVGGELLGNYISIKDDLVTIRGKDSDLSSENALISDVKGKIGGATKAKSENQLKKLMKTPLRYGLDFLRGGGSDGLIAMVVEDMSVDFSETNIQVEGIDEADIIKTDGEYIYYSGDRFVKILKAEEDNLGIISEIKFSDNKNIREIFLDKDKLVVLGDRYEEGGQYRVFAFADIYDVSKPEEARLIKSHEMEGNYRTGRKNGDHVYLITNTGGFGGIIRPLVYDGFEAEDMEAKKYEPLEIDNIMVLPEPMEQGYIILSAINISDESKTEVEAITAYGAEVYMNDSSLYLATYDNEDMAINRFAIDGMNIGYAGTGKVKGHVLNQFSMDEYKGNFRIATSEWDKGNNLFVLDSSLNIIGSVTDFAEGERIYSVRFMGDKGYVVTFKNVDPLFVFDLADPKAPVITGELKIPGFSNYLHPVGEDLILGIGMETNELIERYPDGTEEVVGFREGGLKVSLFDVSDMGKPKEITNLVIGKGGSHSEANYNHKAVMVDNNRQQVGFYGQIVRNSDWSNMENGALIINYENKDLDLKAFLKINENQYKGFYHNRIIYIGDTLYVFNGNVVGIYDYNSFEEIKRIKIH